MPASSLETLWSLFDRIIALLQAKSPAAPLTASFLMVLVRLLQQHCGPRTLPHGELVCVCPLFQKNAHK
jgi:hypothetical protein